MGRCGLHRGTEAEGEAGVGGGLAGGHEAGPATETGSGKHCGPGGEGQGIDTGQGGTSFPGRETAIRLRLVLQLYY